MKHIAMCIVGAALVVGCAKRTPEQLAPPSDLASVLKQKVATILPNGWSPVSIRRSAAVGKEGLYVYAEHSFVTLDGPKGEYHPHIDLYFRPHTATSECYQIQMDGCIYSVRLGHTAEHTVYGSSVGVDLNDRLREALNLKESQNQ